MSDLNVRLRRHLAAGLAAAVAGAIAPSLASAVIVYSENFETDQTANWTFNSSQAGDSAANNSNQEANYFFNYGTGAGIPSAPSGAGTRGLKLEANVPDGTGTFAGFSTSPNGLDLSNLGNYTVRYDMWQNFNGPFPAGGSGSTQVTTSGIGTGGTTSQFPGGVSTATNLQGVLVGSTADGGSGQDYRAYTAVGAPLADTSGTYAAGAVAGSSNNSNPYYGANGFGGDSAPAAQLALFPQQTGSTAAGVQGMRWHTHEITKTGSTVTWEIDNVLIATMNVSTKVDGNGNFTNGNNIFFGQFDVNATLSADPNARALLFGLVDNIVVDAAIPEPAAVSLLALPGLALLRRRRA